MTGADQSPTVLVLGAGGNVSQGMLKALAVGSLHCRLITACITPYATGLYGADRAYVSPPAADPGFIDWLIEVCDTQDVDAVLSGSEPVLVALAPAAQRIREATGAVCIVSAPEILEIGQDKLATCRWLERQGFPHPGYACASDDAALATLIAESGFPLIAKPRRGRSAEGIVQIADEAQLAPVRGRDEMLIQEHIGDPGGEYTVGCFCDAAGTLRGSVAMRRELAGGTTVRAELGDFDDVRELSERIVGALAPLGPCNVQLRTVERGPVPFELNVRFSGTTPMRARLGFNEVEQAIRHFALGEPPQDLPRPRRGTVLRYWNELYVAPESLAALERDGVAKHPHGEVEDWGLQR